MSADNYYLIRKDGEEYVVTCEFASGDPGPIDASGRRFDTLPEARAYADSEYSEYGVVEATDKASMQALRDRKAADAQAVKDAVAQFGGLSS